MPPGGFPPDELNWWYGNMVSSGVRGYLNYTLFHFKLLRPIFLFLWNRTKKTPPGGRRQRAEYRQSREEAGQIPVLNTGGYQDGRLIRKVISEGYFDGVSIARPLIANNDLPQIL